MFFYLVLSEIEQFNSAVETLLFVLKKQSDNIEREKMMVCLSTPIISYCRSTLLIKTCLYTSVRVCVTPYIYPELEHLSTF